MFKYALIASLAASLGLSAALMRERGKTARLEAEIDALGLSLASCSARIANIIEDLETDREVDNLTNDDLRTVPSGWLLNQN